MRFGLLNRNTSSFKSTAFLCVALQFFSAASTLASPISNGFNPSEHNKNQHAVASPEQEYVLLIPAQRETNAHLAARFSVSQSALTALQNQAAQAGWTGQAVLIPRQATGESRMYPAYVTHTLAKNETLGSLALKVNRSELELRRLNMLVLGDAALKNLREGHVLLIPALTPVTRIGKGVETKQHQQDFEMLLANAALQAGEGYRQQAQGPSAAANLLAQQSVSTATNTATRAISSSLEDALKPFGRAQVGVQASTRANSIDLNLDYLHPLLQSHDDILFAQIGTRTFDDRNIANVGLGYRHQINLSLMLGGNAFIDQDFSRSHTRAGVGAEVWGNTARLASNTYVPVSGWRTSDQHRLNANPNRMSLFERPASGWDVRAETLIPGVPQLAATAQYFQWNGKGVDAFGSGKLKTDPTGYGVGARWQPMPLIGIISEHQKLDGGNARFKFGIDVNWSFDQDLKKQLNPAGSIALRPLAQAKQNFVDRNYNIILNYKQEAKYHAFGFTSKSIAVQANPLSGSPVSQSSPMLSGAPASGIVRYELANHSLRVTIDPLSGVITAAPGAEAQHVTVIARLYMPRIAAQREEVGVAETLLASAGNVLRAATAFLIPTAHAADPSNIPQNFIEVADDSYQLAVLEGQPLSIGSIELQIINDRSPANGSSQNIVQAMVKDEAGSPVSSAEVSFTLDNTTTRGSQVAITDAEGLARLSFSSSLAGKMAVTGQANSKTHAVDVYFIPDVISAQIGLKVNKETATLGKDEVTLSGILIDGNRNPVEGVAVGLVATNEAMIVRSAITDAEGGFSVKLQGSKAGKTEVTARIDGDDASTDTVSVLFVADIGTATISGNLELNSNGAVANGAASNALTATVTDAHGNPLEGQNVVFTASNGAVMAPWPVTNDQGQVQVKLTNTTAGISTVTATINDQATSVDTTFVAMLEIVPHSGLAAQILTVGQPGINVKPFHVRGGKGEISYSSGPLPVGLFLDASNGFVSGSPTVEQTATDINFKAVDTDGAVIDLNVGFTVNAATAASANTAAQRLTVDIQAPEFQPLTASGGRAPYAYSIASGALPMGMSLNAATGVVSGIPTAVTAATPITLQVMDANGVAAPTTSTVSYSVAQIFTAIKDSTAQLLKVGRQAPEFQPLTASNGHLLPGQCYVYSVKVGTLPTGLSLDTCTGKVTGTPTTLSGATSVTFQVKDAAGSHMAATVDVRYSVVAALISDFTLPQKTPVKWQTASSACERLGAKLPSRSELRSLFDNYTKGGTNYDMCLNHGWPLGNSTVCGGSSPNYLTRDVGPSGPNGHYVFRMHNGTTDTGGVDYHEHHYTCIK